jgi:hypothetical protein
VAADGGQRARDGVGGSLQEELVIHTNFKNPVAYLVGIQGSSTPLKPAYHWFESRGFPRRSRQLGAEFFAVRRLAAFLGSRRCKFSLTLLGAILVSIGENLG